jgi:hypothetical protein
MKHFEYILISSLSFLKLLLRKVEMIKKKIVKKKRDGIRSIIKALRLYVDDKEEKDFMKGVK